MEYISKLDINTIFKDVDLSKYSHLMTCLNSQEGTCFLKFISNEESLDEVINNIKKQGIFGILSVKEIKDYQLDTKETSTINISEDELTKEINQLNDNKLKKALKYAKKMHKGQYRKDGTEYINHPIRVANYVSQFKKSSNLENLIISAYLHDTLEDTEATYYGLVQEFGPQVASIVLELTTDSDLKKEVGKTKYLAIKLKNMSSWALVIKLCDRLDNISDLMNSDKSFRNRYMEETIEILEYLLNNRILSKTHLNIIKSIVERLILINKICKDLPEELNNKLKNINKKLKSINKKLSLKL